MFVKQVREVKMTWGVTFWAENIVAQHAGPNSGVCLTSTSWAGDLFWVTFIWVIWCTRALISVRYIYGFILRILTVYPISCRFYLQNEIFVWFLWCVQTDKIWISGPQKKKTCLDLWTIFKILAGYIGFQTQKILILMKQKKCWTSLLPLGNY